MVSLLTWEDRALAEAFAGTAPAPGGPFRQAASSLRRGDRGWQRGDVAGVRLESATTVGWSSLVTCVVEDVAVGDDESLVHRRGRYLRPTDG